MNTKLIILILTFFTLNSCKGQSEKETEMYKIDTGEYLCESGNFIINFPTKPTLNVIDNQIGLDKYKIYHYQSKANQNMIYTAQYIDFPKYIIESMDKEQAYNQIIKTLEARYKGDFILIKQESVKKNNLEGIYFEFSIDPNANVKVPEGSKIKIKGEVFYEGNRSYQIMFIGIEHDLIESYLNSFRLIK